MAPDEKTALTIVLHTGLTTPSGIAERGRRELLDLRERVNTTSRIASGREMPVGTHLLPSIRDSRHRIDLRDNRFHQIVNGQYIGAWDENYLEVIIVGMTPTISRIYHDNKYNLTNGGNQHGSICYAIDTNHGPPSDVQNPQSDKCETCQWNVKERQIIESGTKTQACGYFRRIALILPGDDTLYFADINSIGLFSESNKNKNMFNLFDYAKILQDSGLTKSLALDGSSIVTRMIFDTDQSVPKLLFQRHRNTSPEEKNDIQALAEGNQIKEYLTINMTTVDIGGEKSALG